jgi:putative salt-induced outer membrane protein YdiY
VLGLARRLVGREARGRTLRRRHSRRTTCKYDYFFTRQLYGYAGVKIERDRIADLDLRLTPGAGVGYQWFEGPTFNLSTEAGIAWIYEDYRNAGTRDEIAGRLAYHVDWRPVSALLLFHNFEWLPRSRGRSTTT